MNDHELESFETELRRLRPARAPERFRNRLHQSMRHQATVSSRGDTPCASRQLAAYPSSRRSIWRTWLKWLVPVAGAAAIVLTLLFLSTRESDPLLTDGARGAESRVIDEVELNQQLVAAFEGVAEAPGGPPLRFRCYGWREELTLRDASGAIEVEERGPRFEIVPVGFEIY